MGAILMFILIDIICVASLVYLYIEKRNEKKKLQAWHSSKVLDHLVPQGNQPCGIFFALFSVWIESQRELKR